MNAESIDALAWASGGEIIVVDQEVGSRPMTAERAGALAKVYAAKVADPKTDGPALAFLTRWMMELESAIAAAAAWVAPSLAVAA